MSDTPKIRKLSKESFIAFAVLAALALMTDVSALVLVTTRLRATEAAYAVYGVAVALTLTAGVILLIRRKDINTLLTEIEELVKLKDQLSDKKK